MLSRPGPTEEFNERRSRAADFVRRIAILDRAPAPAHALILVLLVVTGLVIRLALVPSAGDLGDIDVFANWFRAIATLAPSEVYRQVSNLNYPPAIVVLYEFEARVLRWTVHGPLSFETIRAAIKLPGILFESAGIVLVYAVIRRFAGSGRALAGAAFIAFNPALIYDTAFWGQNDAIPAVLAFFALQQSLFGSPVLGWLSLGIALFFKPPAALLIPVVVLFAFKAGGAERTTRLRDAAIGVAIVTAVAELLAYVYFDRGGMLDATRGMVVRIVHGSHAFAYTSLNAFNLWGLGGRFFISDNLRFAGLPLRMWGFVLFAVCAVAIYRRYLRDPAPEAIFEAALLLFAALFLCLTEMHERYLYYAVFFSAALVWRGPYAGIAPILTVTMLLNMEYALTALYLERAGATVVDRLGFAPWLSAVCALANIGAFAWGLWAFLNAVPALPVRRPDVAVESGGREASVRPQ